MNLLLFLALLLGCCGYALARGGSPERIAAALLLGAFAAGFPVRLFVDRAGYGSPAIGMAAIDLLLLLALVVLAHRSTRFWPLWLAGWQGAAVVVHIAKMIDPHMASSGYAFQSEIWSYPMILAMAAGAARHRRRRRSGDPDPAWKSQLA